MVCPAVQIEQVGLVGADATGVIVGAMGFVVIDAVSIQPHSVANVDRAPHWSAGTFPASADA